jgi:hypothetical protein
VLIPQGIRTDREIAAFREDASKPIREQNMNKNIVELLKKASQGLVFPSESEYPFEVFLWNSEGKDLDESKLLEKVGQSGGPVKVVDVDTFFKNVVEEKDWQDVEEKRDVKKFQELVQTLKGNLAHLKVFRLGQTEIDVYIVGKTEDGAWAGLKTTVVET